MAETATFTEADILSDVIVPEKGDMTHEAARSVLKWKFTDRALRRIDRLADRSRKGTISEGQRHELEMFQRVGSLLNLIQAKARCSLKKRNSTAD